MRTIVYRMPEPKKPAKAAKGEATPLPGANEVPTRTRPDVTQKGNAIIGDLRTDALHQAFKQADIDDRTLIALLVLALAGKNVNISSGASVDHWGREAIAASITEGGVLTAAGDTVRIAARSMLTASLSCRDNMTSSGNVARIAGDAIGSSLYLPNMATDEFLSCLSKSAVEKAATAEGVRAEARAKDTRARLIERFKDGVYVYPPAHFSLSAEELKVAKEAEARRYVPGHGWGASATADREDPDLDGLDAEFEEDAGVDAAPLVTNDRVDAAVAHAAE